MARTLLGLEPRREKIQLELPKVLNRGSLSTEGLALHVDSRCCEAPPPSSLLVALHRPVDTGPQKVRRAGQERVVGALQFVALVLRAEV